MFLNAKRPPTIVRKVVTTVKKEPAKKDSPQAQRNGESSNSHLKPQDAQRRRANGAASIPHRPQSSARKPSPASAKASNSQQYRPKPLKRKISSPAAPMFGSDSNSEDEEETALDFLSKKRIRSTSPNLRLQSDDNRVAFEVREWSIEDKKSSALIESTTIVSGKYAHEYAAHVFDNIKETRSVKLRFPSGALPERYALVATKDESGYQPMEDLRETMDLICRHYLPSDLALTLTNDNTGLRRRLIRATTTGDFKLYKETVEEFNSTLKAALKDGRVAQTLKEQNGIAHDLVQRIIEQVYSRTVSPEVNLLKAYENGTSNVYGELLPRLSYKIFEEVGLKSDHVFVDLGSGVGNVVLQAALEVGCESWGIEQMPNPAGLAKKQKKEFEERCKSWSINHGAVQLLHGDFLASPKIDDAIRRADVILINNQAFTPELNDAILMKLLDVKEGGRIVSLKSFVPDGWEIKKRSLEDPRNLLNVVKKEYFSDSVSWTSNHGTYYIATVDRSHLRAFRDGDH